MLAKTLKNFLLIALGYLILIILVNPAGDFPVNDDWAYARSVLHLVENGEFRLLDWGAMTLLTQVLWGSLWVKLFGFSFEVLRFSTIALGLMALGGCYKLILGLSKNNWMATAGTLILMVNPLFLVLSNSFMTDVPFLALSTWSAFFLLRSIEEDSTYQLLLGTCLAIAAVLLRQIALALLLAFLLGYVLHYYRTMSFKRLAVSITPFAIGSTTYVAYMRWLEINDNLPYAMTWSQERLYTNLLGLFDGEYADLVFYLGSAGSMLLYLGLFALPLLLIQHMRRSNKGRPGSGFIAFWGIAGILCFAIGGALLTNDISMPVRGNVLTAYGIGPFTLRDVYALGLPHLDAMSRTILQFITMLSVLGAILLVHGLAVSFRTPATGPESVDETSLKRSRGVFLWTLMAAYLAPLVLTDYFDRYLIFLLPFIFALVCMRDTSAKGEGMTAPGIAPLLFALVFGIFSFALVHDYMNWNRVRLQANDWIIEEYHVDQASIDSGFELNGFHGYDSRYHNDQSNWVRDDKYVLGFGGIPGYETRKHFVLERLLPIGPREIVISRRRD